MARRRFFVEAVEDGYAQLSGQEAHHVTHVLRAEAGQRFEISDNHHVYLAEVESVAKTSVSLRVVERMEAPAPVVRSSLLASLVKFERFEWMLEKATELGVDDILPIIAERSESGLDKAALKRLPRWTRILREASEQSRRAHLPNIDGPIKLEKALQMAADYRYVLEEAVAQPILSAMPPDRKPDDHVILLVGPEGGWTDRERMAMASARWTPVSLGTNILRAETAAVAGLAIVQAAWAARAR